MITRPDAILTTALQQRLVAWCCGQGADVASAESLTARLCGCYAEPQRHYHHLGHIAGSLTELDLHAPGDVFIEGAIWFHDVIYDPTRRDNETASIAWFLEETREWIHPDSSAGISRLIEATDFRIAAGGSPGIDLMIDIDLAILSAAPEDYDAYTRAIRFEYAHVPEEDFRIGRAKVMAHFLARPIYRTNGFLSREDRARRNIQRELEKLPSPW